VHDVQTPEGLFVCEELEEVDETTLLRCNLHNFMYAVSGLLSSSCSKVLASWTALLQATT
jgi:hypothetical protein